MTASMTTTSIMLVRVISSASDADYTLESNCGCRDTAGLPQHPYVAVTGYIRFDRIGSLGLPAAFGLNWITIPLWEPPLSRNAIFGSRNGSVPSLQLVSALFVIAYFTFL